jgi:glycosyltransferase involved in cell wall biosynthesis
VATPEVAILISTRNRYRELCRAVESCLRQKDIDFDIIICDDASTDETPEIAGCHPRVKYRRSEGRLGQSIQRAIAIAETSYRYIFTMDDDAFFVSPQTLARVVNLAEEYRDTGAFAVPYMEPRGRFLNHHEAGRLCTLRSFAAGATLLDREKTLKAGNFPDWIGVWGGEEREVSYRLWERGWPILYDPSIPPLVHLPSTVRSRADMSFYGIRNQIISDWINVPTAYLIPTLVTHSLRLLLYKFTWQALPRKIAGLTAGYASFLRIKRRPLSVAVYRKIMKLPRHGSIPLDREYLRQHGVEHWLEITRSSPTGSDVSRCVPE